METNVINQTEHADTHRIIDERREALRPYKHQRLGFEGVFIHVIPPMKRNGYKYGLVFASVYAPNEQIEIDHVVIQMNPAEYHACDLELFSRYYFTAEVGTYFKTGFIMGTIAQQEYFMLKDINTHRLEKIESSHMTQPTAYVRARIKTTLRCKTTPPMHTEKQLLEIVTNLPNDGSVERFINEYTQLYQHERYTKHDIIQMLD